MSLKETGLAGGSLQARSDDQLSGSISSENTASAAATQAKPAAVKFHPLADIFPLLEGEEFDALVADIKANGVQFPIILYDGMILDGRNRYRAAIAAGIDFKHRILNDRWIDDPAAYVVSANLHRRHFTAEQKREVIARLIKAKPATPDLQIAKAVKASPTTVGTVRAKMEATGDVSKLETRPDSKGRQQPAKKVRKLPAHKPTPHKLTRREREHRFSEEDNQVVAILIERLGRERARIVYHAMAAVGAYPLQVAIGRTVDPNQDDALFGFKEFVAKYAPAGTAPPSSSNDVDAAAPAEAMKAHLTADGDAS
jgi:ParB-like chromosome segregation protein Spo0J